MQNNIQSLIKKYPVLLGKLRGGRIEIPDDANGWYDILDCFLAAVQADCEWLYQKDTANYPSFLIIKEKFASLNVQGTQFHVDHESNEQMYYRICGQVSLLEKISSRVCMLSGRPGVLAIHHGNYVTVDLTNPEFAAKYKRVDPSPFRD